MEAARHHPPPRLDWRQTEQPEIGGAWYLIPGHNKYLDDSKWELVTAKCLEVLGSSVASELTALS